MTRRSIPVLAVIIGVSAVSTARADGGKADVRETALWLAKEGEAAFHLERYADALGKFEAAYRIFPTPNLLLDLSHTELKLDDCDAAQSYADTYAATFDGFDRKLTGTLERPDKWLARLDAKCPQVEITSEPTGAVLAVQDIKPANPHSTPWTGRLPIGSHTITVSLRRCLDATERIEVGEGGTRTQVHLSCPVPHPDEVRDIIAGLPPLENSDPHGFPGLGSAPMAVVTGPSPLPTPVASPPPAPTPPAVPVTEADQAVADRISARVAKAWSLVYGSSGELPVQPTPPLSVLASPAVAPTPPASPSLVATPSAVPPSTSEVERAKKPAPAPASKAPVAAQPSLRDEW